MAIEIERKYLVDKKQWEQVEKPAGQLFRQGYLLMEPEKTIRVRQTSNKGFLTIKGISTGASRPEYEYEIPVTEATELLDTFSIAELSKTRYPILFEGKLWEVDEFYGDNQGLVLAEIELSDEAETFALPPWVDKEVTGDKKYYNSNLTIHPYSTQE